MKSKWAIASSIVAVLLLALVAGLTQAQGPEPQGGISTQAVPLGTASTYQGQLKKDGNPVNGNCDFQFGLWDAISGGTQIGSQTKTNVSVSNGLFTIPDLDFGVGAFQEFWANVDNVNPHTHFRSLMIWCLDIREIYVIDGSDTDVSEDALLAYTDFWTEGMAAVPPACAGMTVPSGYQLSVRSFGKVWCDNVLVNLEGWPAQPEASLRQQSRHMRSAGANAGSPAKS